MSIFYSAGWAGFFDSNVHASIPDDAVQITAKRHADLISQQEAGGTIVADAKGRPVIEKLRAEDLRSRLIMQVKAEAARRIEEISPIWRQLNDMRQPSEEGGIRFDQLDAVREAGAMIERQLQDLKASMLSDVPIRDNPIWPQFDSEFD